MRTYAEHLDAWEEIDRLGYDGLGFNEHHCSPYGLMNSPNLMAASAAQRTKRVKLLIYGNLLPLHEPLRLAEELAMLDCLSNGRLISGFARGIPREYQVHNVALAESRARFEEAYEIVTRAWTEDVFSYQGKFWSYQRCRAVAAPGAAARIRKSGCRWSAARNRSSSPRATTSASRPAWRPAACRTTSSRYYAKCLAAQRARDHAGPSVARLSRLCRRQQGTGGAASAARICCISTARCSATATSPRPALQRRDRLHAPMRPPTMCGRRTCAPPSTPASDFRNMTMEDVARMAERLPWGTPQEVAAAHHRAGRSYRCRHGADRLQPRRHAAGDVPRTDPALRPRRAADRAGAPDHARAGGGGSDGVTQPGSRRGAQRRSRSPA